MGRIDREVAWRIRSRRLMASMEDGRVFVEVTAHKRVRDNWARMEKDGLVAGEQSKDGILYTEIT